MPRMASGGGGGGRRAADNSGGLIGVTIMTTLAIFAGMIIVAAMAQVTIQPRTYYN
jgi:hypothetical protein